MKIFMSELEKTVSHLLRNEFDVTSLTLFNHFFHISGQPHFWMYPLSADKETTSFLLLGVIIGRLATQTSIVCPNES